MNLNILYFI